MLNKHGKIQSTMTDDELKKGMAAVFKSITTRMGEETKADPLYTYLSSKKEWFGDPEDMHTMITFKYEEIIHAVVKIALDTDDHMVCDIYTDWDLFDAHVTRLCSTLYGSACSADRGRFIVKSFIKYRLSKTMPVFDPKPENYHHPKTGTPEQWMEFVEGIGRLKYGIPDMYLMAFKVLMDTVPKAYKPEGKKHARKAR